MFELGLSCVRCLAVSVVGLFVYSELAHKNLHSKLNESLQVILNSLMVCLISML